METKENNSNKESRRNFLRTFFFIGSGAVLGSAAVFAANSSEKKKVSGEKIKVLTVNNELVEVDKNEIIKVNTEKYKPLSELQKRGREGIKGRRWTMVIDLSKCKNARKCMSACQEAHHLKPEQHHINVLQIKESKETGAYFMPKLCQHCDNPPCVSVCPVDATFKRQDGIVLIDNERCIGCRFCMAACPYSARIFNWTEPLNSEEDKDIPYDVEKNVPQKKGTVSKCLFSADRCREGKLPYCVSACPNGVYYFGDENEDAVTNGTTHETVQLGKLLEDNGGYRLMPELGTETRVYYLPAKNRTQPFPEELLKNLDEHL